MNPLEDQKAAAAPPHPGAVLRTQFLRPLGITQKAFAAHTGITYTRLNEIINGRRRVTPDRALAIAEALCTRPEYWLNLQRDWDLWQARRRHARVTALGLLHSSPEPETRR